MEGSTELIEDSESWVERRENSIPKSLAFSNRYPDYTASGGLGKQPLSGPKTRETPRGGRKR